MAKNVYDEDFKRLIVSLYQNGKTQTQLSKDYGISLSAINKWVKQYSEIKTEDSDVFRLYNKSGAWFFPCLGFIIQP